MTISVTENEKLQSAKIQEYGHETIWSIEIGNGMLDYVIDQLIAIRKSIRDKIPNPLDATKITKD